MAFALGARNKKGPLCGPFLLDNVAGLMLKEHFQVRWQLPAAAINNLFESVGHNTYCAHERKEFISAIISLFKLSIQ